MVPFEGNVYPQPLHQYSPMTYEDLVALRAEEAEEDAKMKKKWIHRFMVFTKIMRPNEDDDEDVFSLPSFISPRIV